MTEKLPPLRECPFCGGEATIDNAGGKYQAWCKHCCCIHMGEFYNTEAEAITAWNRRAQPENEPLTLDELRQLREAQIPVWMGRAKEWIFVASVADAPYAQVWYFNAKGFAQTVLYYHEKFYRSKPKEDV